MNLLRVAKRPVESSLLTFDFSQEPEVKAGNVITSVDSPIIVDPSGTLSAANGTFVGAIVSTRLTAGTAGIRYIVKCRVNLANGSKLQKERMVEVLEPVR